MRNRSCRATTNLRLTTRGLLFVVAFFLAAMTTQSSSTVLALNENTATMSLLPTSIPDECQPNNHNTHNGRLHRYTSLACWFYFLRVDLPDQSFRSHFLKISIEDLVCTNFTLQSLDSHYASANSNSSAALALGLADLSATCTGRYRSTGFSGDIQAVITTGAVPDNDDDALVVNVVVGDNDKDHKDGDNEDNDDTSSDPIRLLWTVASDFHNPLQILQPSKIQTASCLADLKLSSLHFTGSISAHMIDLFRHSIKHYVQDQVSKQFCPAFYNLLDPILNQYLHDVTDFLNQHLQLKQQTQLKQKQFTMTMRRMDETTKDDTTHDDDNDDDDDGFYDLTDDDFSNNSSNDKDDDNNDKDDPTDDDPGSQAVRWATEAPTLVNSLQMVNAFVQRHLNHGFLPTWFPSLKDLDLKTCGFFFHGINGVIRAILDLQNDDNDDDDDKPDNDDDNVWYSLPLPPRLHNISFVWESYGAIELDIYDIALAGLDRWSVLQLFSPTVDDTFASRLRTDHPIQVQIKAALNVSAIPGGIFSSNHNLHEDFTITLILADLDWNTTLALWVDKSLWDTNVTTGVLMDVIKGLWPKGKNKGEEASVVPQEALRCLLQSILDFSSPRLSVNTLLESLQIVPTLPPTAPNHQRPTSTLVSTDLEQALDDLFNRAIQLMIQGYPDYVSASIAGLVDGPVRTSLDEFLRRVTNSSVYDFDDNNDNSTNASSCPVPNRSGEPHLLNFSEVLPIQALQDLMSHTKTIRRMNKYIQCTADYMARAMLLGNTTTTTNLLDWFVEDEPSEVPVVEDEFNQYRLEVTDLSFQNIGQIETLKLLEPKDDGLTVSNSLVYGGASLGRQGFPHLAVQLALQLPNITSAANITFYWNELFLEGSSLLHYNVNQLKSYGLARVFQHGHCLLVPVGEFKFFTSAPLLGLFEAVVNASVVLHDGSNQSLSYSLSTTNYPTVRGLATSILHWVVSSGSDFTNLASIYSLSQSHELCEGHALDGNSDGDDENEDYSASDFWSMLLILVAMVVLAQPAVFMLRASADSDSESPPAEEPAALDSGYGLTEPLLDPGMGESFGVSGTTEIKSESETKEPALVDCPHIPGLVRVCLPMLILVTLGVLLSANLSVGATVELNAVIGHKTLELPTLFEFSLFQTARDMWEAGIYPLFLLVVIFSGVWPYAKLLIMFVCFVSRRILDGRRGQILLALDSLGKFSLVDTYVLVLMMVAFRYHLRFFDQDVIALDVFVVPQYGFYGFLLATSLSLVVGHAAVYYHRVAEIAFPSSASPEPQCPPQSLLYHSFQIQDSRRQLSQSSRILLLSLWVATAVLLGVGFTKKSFVFEFGGLAGIALGEEERRTAYSLISLGASIPGSSHETFGTYVLMVVYFFYAVAAPFLCLYFLLILLLFPMSVQRQLWVLTLAEIANAWSAVEVFCLSIVAALLEISTFASFIMGDRCDAINEIIKEYWPNHHETEDANCYTVRSSLNWNAGILIAGALLNSFVVSVTLRLVHIAMDDRMRQGGFISLGSETPFDSLSQPNQQRSFSFMERVVGVSSVVSWLLLLPNERTNVGGEDTEEDPNNDANSNASPWERGDGFIREWDRDAERDPTWRAWKEQGNPPSSEATAQEANSPEQAPDSHEESPGTGTERARGTQGGREA